MKTCLRDLFLLLVLIAGLGLMLSDRVMAQTFTTVHSFTATSASFPGSNSDGANPYGLILSGNTLYGTAGPASVRSGTIFKVNTDGTGFIIVRNFSALSYRTNSDGAGPVGVILSGNTLYGTANDGGSSGHGTVFAVNTNGTGFTTLHDFTGSDGYEPIAGVILSGNSLYGTAYGGGSSGYGTIFALKTDGTGFANLHSFAGGSDGSGPRAGLILSGNTLYGTASESGSGGNGTVFAISTDGTGFTTLHSFTAVPADPPYTNSD